MCVNSWNENLPWGYRQFFMEPKRFHNSPTTFPDKAVSSGNSTGHPATLSCKGRSLPDPPRVLIQHKLLLIPRCLLFHKQSKDTSRHVSLRRVRYRLVSVRMEQLGSHWTDFHKIYRIIFRKSVEKNQVSLNSDKNNGSFIWKARYIYDNISLKYKKCFRQKL